MLVKEEIDKLLEASIIFPIPYNEWVSPIIVVPKKNGKLQLCVDYQMLNNVTMYEYFSLPITNTMLDKVLSYDSFIYLFIYILVYRWFPNISKPYSLLTALQHYEEFMHIGRMPFGLCNSIGTLFQIRIQYVSKISSSYHVRVNFGWFCNLQYNMNLKHASIYRNIVMSAMVVGHFVNTIKSMFLVSFRRVSCSSSV